MNQPPIAPKAVWEACLRGLALHRRTWETSGHDNGATQPAVSFAEIVTDGFPIDAQLATEVVDAHMALDRAALVNPDGDSPKAKLQRLLWGGDTAPDWGRNVLDQARSQQLMNRVPAPVTPFPAAVSETEAADTAVAAEASTAEADAVLERLSLELAEIDAAAIAALETAWWVAYRAALRAAGHNARGAVRRNVPKSVQAEAGLEENELNEARERAAEAHIIDAWPAVGGRVMAVITADLDTAVQDSLEDFELVATQVLGSTVAGAVLAISRRLGVDQDTIRPFTAQQDSITAAVEELKAQLLEWTRLRLEGEREPEGLDELVVPSGIFTEAVATSAGVAASDDVDAAGNSILDRVIGAVASGGLAVTGFRLFRDLVSIRPRRRFMWDYGNPATRIVPYEPHIDLDGKTWANEAERREVIGNASPREHSVHCQCRIRPVWSLS